MSVFYRILHSKKTAGTFIVIDSEWVGVKDEIPTYEEALKLIKKLRDLE